MDVRRVVMKALEKDRMRRYEEISALAFDIRSYLEHRPIVARAPSLAYRLNKFVRRNSVNLTMALVSVIIVSAAILLFVSRYRAHIRITEAESRSHSKLLSQGHIFYRNWQYGMALEQSRAILRSPHVGEQARSLRELALAKVQEELESYCQRIKKNPEIMDNYFFRALLYRQLGEEELARSDMAQYIARVEQGGNFAVQLGTAEKLGPAINSPNLADNEWKPRVSMDGLSLSFFRNLDEDWEVWVSLRTTMQSLWNMAYRDVIGTGPKVPILGDTPSDGLEFYAWGTLPGGYGLSDILVRIRESIKDPWGETQNIGATINTHNHEKMAQVSPDGLELYFCREPAEVSRPTSQGGADLWMSRRAARNARWQEPINLGVNVNSEARDIRPHISADSLLLFFASNRPGGLGGYDLYVTQRKTPSDPWEEVINLGPRVNSPVDELYPAISPDGRMLYFSRDGDIWQASVFSIVNNSSPAAITSPGNHSGRPNQGKEVIQEKKQ